MLLSQELLLNIVGLCLLNVEYKYSLTSCSILINFILGMADLEGYPIIRLDQIPMLEMDTLVQVEEDGLCLLNSLLEEEGGVDNPMVKYLQRQVEQTRAEIVQRNASTRILDLLEGRVSEVVNESRYAPGSLSRAASNTQVTALSVSSTSRVSNSPSMGQDVKTACGDTEHHVAPLNTTWNAPAYKPHAAADSTGFSTNSDMPGITPKRPPRPRSGDAASTGASNVTPASGNKGDITSRSDSSRSPSKRAGACAGAGGASVFYGDKDNVANVRGNNLSNNNPGDIFYSAAAKKRAEMVQSQNFGSMFVVQNTDRKVRFIPKKKTAQELYEESPEGIKEKERKIRRQNAMARLMQVQEKRMQKLEVRTTTGNSFEFHYF